MSISKTLDYFTEAINRLLQQFKGLPRWEGLLTSYMTETQAVEDAFWDIFVDRLLQSDLATGDLLDKLGSIVGIARQGFTDGVYKLLITAKIKANRSDGKHETLIDIMALLVPGATIFVYESVGFIILEPHGAILAPPYVVAKQFLGIAVAAGIGIYLVWTEVDDSLTLKFGTEYTTGGLIEPTADQSPGSYYIGGITGGQFAGAINGE